MRAAANSSTRDRENPPPLLATRTARIIASEPRTDSLAALRSMESFTVERSVEFRTKGATRAGSRGDDTEEEALIALTS